MPKDFSEVLGIKNNNPWNVKEDPRGGKWLGQVGVDKNGLVKFMDPSFSGRAALRTIANSVLRRGNTILYKLFAEYSPVNDPKAKNNPEEYTKAVMQYSGVDNRFNLTELFNNDGEVKDVEKLSAIMKAMAKVEVDAEFNIPSEVVDYAIYMYGRDF